MSKYLNMKEFEKLIQEKDARYVHHEKFGESCPWCRSTLLRDLDDGKIYGRGPGVLGGTDYHLLKQCDNCNRYVVHKFNLVE